MQQSKNEDVLIREISEHIYYSVQQILLMNKQKIPPNRNSVEFFMTYLIYDIKSIFSRDFNDFLQDN